MNSQTINRRLYAPPGRKNWGPGLLLVPLVTLAGCSGGPTSLPIPSFDPGDSAEQAMEIYDTDGDGFVAGEELENAAGLRATLRSLDTDGDGKVSEAEVAERVRAWDKMQIGMMNFDALFLMDGKPLAEAKVTFDPEEFLGGVVQAGLGETDMGGGLRPRVPKENRPTPDSPPGMQAGIYKVRVSKIVDGEETIPAKYNTETIFGQEVSKDNWEINNRRVIFKLKSK